MNWDLIITIVSALVLIAGIADIFYLNKRRREAEIINTELESIASIYVAMYMIDLTSDTISEVLCNDEKLDSLLNGRRSNASSVLKFAVENLVDEQSKEGILEFIDFSTLKERLLNTNTITCEFLDKRDIWCRGRFVVAGRRSSNEPCQVLWMVEVIDEEKRMRDMFKYLSEIDRMTGLNNRGSGEEKIQELLKSLDSGMFCLMDIDDFKSINDNFGHDVGDLVLIEFTRCLKRAFRETDVVMRMGGDEFEVFAPLIESKETGERIIARLFDAVEEFHLDAMGNKKIFISVGVAFASESCDLKNLFKKADTALYESKKKQGNAVTFAKE